MTDITARRTRLGLATGLFLVLGIIAMTQGYRFTHLREVQQTREVKLEEQVAAKINEVDAERLRFGMILEGSPVAVVVCDSHGKITACNDAARKLFGYAPSELIGKQSAVLVSDKLRPRHIEYMAAAPQKLDANHNQIRSHFEGEAKRKDGTTFLVKITCAGIIVDGSPEFAAFIKPKDAPEGS